MVKALLAPTYINEFRIISLSKIVKNSGIIEVRQVSHIFDFLEFRGVYLWEEFLF